MVAAATTVDPRTRLRAIPDAHMPAPYEPRGGARSLFGCTEPQILIEGPAGTGKSLAALKVMDRSAIKYPGSRQLIVRKTRTSLTQTALVTFENHVLVPGGRVRFHTTQQAYLYPNGSKIVVGGLDKDSKIMSSEYDRIYVQEATECLESDIESLTTRLRWHHMPYQQLICDCNPDTDTHWLNQRCNSGLMHRIISRHEDNPTLWDRDNRCWTADGQQYIAVLDRLTGVRYKRLRLGLWVAAEGQVYEGWDPAIHIIDRFEIPASWSRVWTIDFGFTNPFVWQCWAVDPDGRLILYREIYMTGRLVEDHAQRILTVTRDEPKPTVVITDHDAEDRATFERKTGIRTTPARKDVSPGIQAFAERLRPAADGRPRVLFMRDSLVERDSALAEKKLPTCTVEEFPSYIWDESANRKRGEQPRKEFDHGMDAGRYTVAHFDIRSRGARARSF